MLGSGLKPFWQSKTVWLNALTLLVAVIGFVAAHPLIVAHPQWVAGLVAVQAVVNVILRFVSTDQLTLTP